MSDTYLLIDILWLFFVLLYNIALYPAHIIVPFPFALLTLSSLLVPSGTPLGKEVVPQLAVTSLQSPNLRKRAMRTFL